MNAWAGVIHGAGRRAFAFGAGIIAPLIGAAKIFQSMGDKLAKMSDRTGIAVEALSELGYAAEQSGADLETLETGVRKMQKLLSDAATGSAGAVMTLQQLGFSVKDLLAMNPEQQFEAIGDRLSKIADPTLRAAMALEMFGKSGTKLLPLLKSGAAGVRELREQARALGLQISTEDARAAETLGDRWDDLWKVLKSGVFSVGAVLAPLLTDLTIEAIRITKSVVDWVKENRGLAVSIFKIAAGVAAAGAGLLVFAGVLQAMAFAVTPILAGMTLLRIGVGLVASAFSMVGTVLSVAVFPLLKGLLAVATASVTGLVKLVIGGAATLASSFASAIMFLITNPIALLGVALVGVAVYLVYMSGVWTTVVNGMKKAWSAFTKDASSAWGGLVDAIKAGKPELAFRIIVAFLKLEWLRVVDVLKTAWSGFSLFFADVFDAAVTNVASILNSFWSGIRKGWAAVVYMFKNGWDLFSEMSVNAVQGAHNAIARWIAPIVAEATGQNPDDVMQTLLEDQQRAAAAHNADPQVTARRERITKGLQEFNARNDRIDADRADAEKIIRDENMAREDSRHGGADAAKAARQKEIEDQRKALDDLRQQARAALNGEKTTTPDSKKYNPRLPPDLSGVKASVVGTFSGAAVSGLGAGDGLQARIASASESTAKSVKKLEKKKAAWS